MARAAIQKPDSLWIIGRNSKFIPNLHGGLGGVFQPSHVAEHAFDVLQHVARAHAQQFAFSPVLGVGGVGPLVQRVDPLLDRATLVFAGVFQPVQRLA